MSSHSIWFYWEMWGGNIHPSLKFLASEYHDFPWPENIWKKKKIFFCGGVEKQRRKRRKILFYLRWSCFRFGIAPSHCELCILGERQSDNKQKWLHWWVWRYMVQETQRPVVDVAHTGPPGLDVQGLRQTWCWASTALAGPFMAVQICRASIAQ